MEDNKKCVRCELLFPKTPENFAFYQRKKHNKAYYQSICKGCTKIKMAELYREVPKYECGCGSIISKRTIRPHNNSKKHQKYLAEENSTAGEELKKLLPPPENVETQARD